MLNIKAGAVDPKHFSRRRGQRKESYGMPMGFAEPCAHPSTAQAVGSRLKQVPLHLGF